jgi:probable blue pigment (indigoidine) exporter
MKTSSSDLLITALAPAIWGSTYIVTTQFLPQGYPLTVAVLRALPAGLLLLLFVRRLPWGIWWLRVSILGALNISLFLSLLFVSAYRLPGGIAATIGAVQPLMVVLLAGLLLGNPIRILSVLAAFAGLSGVALLVMTPKAALDPLGIAAGLAGAACMALGTVLSRRWQPPVSPLAFTAWQLTVGGVLLLPAALYLEPALPPVTTMNLVGFAWLSLIGAALTYMLWFRGIARLDSAVVSSLTLLSPMVAMLLGWIFLHQTLSAIQIAGGALVIIAIEFNRRAQLRQP